MIAKGLAGSYAGGLGFCGLKQPAKLSMRKIFCVLKLRDFAGVF